MADYTPREAKQIEDLKTQLFKQDYAIRSDFKGNKKDMLEWNGDWTETEQELWDFA